MMEKESEHANMIITKKRGITCGADAGERDFIFLNI
jgi:hypothetical protein